MPGCVPTELSSERRMDVSPPRHLYILPPSSRSKLLYGAPWIAKNWSLLLPTHLTAVCWVASLAVVHPEIPAQSANPNKNFSIIPTSLTDLYGYWHKLRHSTGGRLQIIHNGLRFVRKLVFFGATGD
ncbi:protein of unknown function [Nitratireductor aquimarinus]